LRIRGFHQATTRESVKDRHLIDEEAEGLAPEECYQVKKLTLKYRNEGHNAFRKAITSGKGNFFLALGENGAIYGGLS
jgi:hypothetical protein